MSSSSFFASSCKSKDYCSSRDDVVLCLPSSSSIDNVQSDSDEEVSIG